MSKSQAPNGRAKHARNLLEYREQRKRCAARVANRRANSPTIHDLGMMKLEEIRKVIAEFDETGNVPSAECETPASNFYAELES